MKIYVLDVGKLNNKELFDRLYDSMQEYRKAKIDKFKPLLSKQLSLGAGWLLQYAIKESGRPELICEIEESDSGKPYIMGQNLSFDSLHSVKESRYFSQSHSVMDSLYFNLSHSGQKVMCVVDSEPVGCDIQIMQEGISAIARKFYTDDEKRYVFGTDYSLTEELSKYKSQAENNYQAAVNYGAEKNSDSIKDRFYRIWVRKEAYVKYTGEGMRRNFSEFSVWDLQENFWEYKFDNYRMAVCRKNCQNIRDSIVPEFVEL